MIYPNELAPRRKPNQLWVVCSCHDSWCFFFKTIFLFHFLKVHRKGFERFFLKGQKIPKFSPFFFFVKQILSPRVWFESKGPEEMDRIHQNHFGCDPGAKQKKHGLFFFWVLFLKLMVNRWFRARWFGIRIGVHPRIPIPFIFGDPFGIQTTGPQTNKPNH